ncbi:MAG: hypothetical protein DRR03_03055 [Gammaproteobacteria bacterium]|nr:MAG: hypothetical protein DRR03_03055 [Gammaproteobacteria bacterium]
MKTKMHALAMSALLVTATSLVLAATEEATAPVEAVVEAAPEATDPGEHKFELAKEYYAQCRGVDESDFEKIRTSLKAFTDAEVMVDTMADPVRFMKLMNIVNDPRVMHVMMKCSSEPVMWDTWMRGASDPDKMMRAMGRFMDPGMYMAWMMAPMNPQVMEQMTAMADPNRYLVTWPQGLSNPEFYQPFFAPLDPAWQQARMEWMMNPASYQPMIEMFTNYAAMTTAYAAPAIRTN